ncbi:MAG: hypothetical protein H7143_05655 [Pseudorhodobacter sp.]|nr:hypothetical protein [Rhizobacter sp.]
MHRHAFLRVLTVAVSAVAFLGGCDALGIESPEKLAAVRDADGKAIGGACRHAGRAIEDCYALNKKADKAAVFAGWRDMNDYMRENKIEPVPPQLATQTLTQVASAKAAQSDEAVEEKPSAKAGKAKDGKAKDSKAQ